MKQHTLGCEYPEGCNCGASEWNRMERKLTWYKRRIELLEKNQHRMRDPERTLVCDILANGQMLPDENRYKVV